MKKRTRLALIIAATAMVMAGCSGNKNAASGEQSNNQQESTTQQSEAKISEEEALQIALDNAKVAKEDVTNHRVKKEYDDGVLEYEVDFYVGNQEYDYDIDANTGAIRSKDTDIEDDFLNANGQADNANGEVISEADAAAIALAKVPGAAESDLKMELEMDDGRKVYEGSIRYQNKEYEFEIDAATGDIISWEQDD